MLEVSPDRYRESPLEPISRMMGRRCNLNNTVRFGTGEGLQNPEWLRGRSLKNIGDIRTGDGIREKKNYAICLKKSRS